MLHRCVVTGLGAVTPLGVSAPETWAGVLSGASAVCALKESWVSRVPSKVGARVADSEDPQGQSWGDSGLGGMPRFVAFAQAAADEALRDARWLLTGDGDSLAQERTGIAMGAGMGSVADIGAAAVSLSEAEKGGSQRKKARISPYFVPRILVNSAAGAVSIRHKLRGPSIAPSTACAAGAHAIGEAYRAIQLGEADVMVAGGAEASVNEIAFAGFCKARALSTGFNAEPWRASRPFDKMRDGFVMGEGAGVLVLENRDHAISRGAHIYCELAGFGSSGDAYHVTHPDPSGRGAMLAMRGAMKGANLSHVSYVNAHATSTPIGDDIELGAVSSVMDTPAGRTHFTNISSTKGATGHLLGAAGAVEAVITVLSLYNKRFPPNTNLENPTDAVKKLDETVRLIPSLPGGEPFSGPLTALSNSFGFGEAAMSLAFLGRYDTVKYVRVRNRGVATLYWSLAVAILSYVVYSLLARQGYQSQCLPLSSVNVKVKGTGYLGGTQNETMSVYDATDLVQLMSSGFFVPTSMRETSQKVGKCRDGKSTCSNTTEPCVSGRSTADGIQTGICLSDSHCEVYGYCPQEPDTSLHRIEGVENFTAFIRMSVNFPCATDKLGNSLSANNINGTTLSPGWNLFTINELLQMGNIKYEDVYESGADILAKAYFNCDLDTGIKHCVPSPLKVVRIDSRSIPSFGYNIRKSQFVSKTERNLIKFAGIRVRVQVSGAGRYFDIVALLTHIGSGIALLGLATVIVDVIVLNLLPSKGFFTNLKYTEMQLESAQDAAASEPLLGMPTGMETTNTRGKYFSLGRSSSPLS